PQLTLTGGKADAASVVCAIPLRPGDPAEKVKTLRLTVQAGNTVVPAQLLKASLLQGEGQYRVFIIPKIKAGEKVAIAPADEDAANLPQFKFVEKQGEYTDLRYGDKLVLRYFNAPHDPKDHFYTFKPFHQVFDPATGKTSLTTTAYKTNKEGLYPHH